MEPLETQLDRAFKNLEISGENQNKVKIYLNLMKLKDIPTYEHGVRVGLLGKRIAEYIHLDPKALFYSGLLHDVGKILVPSEILKKTEGFSDKDYKIIKKHPHWTHLLLKDIYAFSAEISYRHHKWQEQGYPKRITKTTIPLSQNSELMIGWYSRLLAIADFYDAIMNRKNDKFGDNNLSPENARNILLAKNKDQEYLIKELYKAKVLR